MPLTLEIVTPERRLLSVQCDEVRAPGVDGGFGIRPRHAPFITALDPGELIYVDGGQEHKFVIGGGFLQVSNDKVIVLADTAERLDEIDVERARRAFEDATVQLRRLREDDPEFALQSARVRRASARIGVIAH